MPTTPTALHGGAPPRRLLFWIIPVVLAALVAYVIVLESDWHVGGSTVVHGSGVAAIETRDVAPFAGIELAGTNDVTVHVGGAQRVLVSADDNLIGRIRTTVRNGVLVIDERGSFSTVTPMRVDVTVPTLERVELTGTGAMAVDGIAADELEVDVPGTGSLSAGGAVARLNATLSGSGNAELRGLIARDVRASLPGTGRLAVTATESLDASVSGTGAIYYAGNPPNVTKNVTGLGAIVEQEAVR